MVRNSAFITKVKRPGDEIDPDSAEDECYTYLIHTKKHCTFKRKFLVKHKHPIQKFQGCKFYYRRNKTHKYLFFLWCFTEMFHYCKYATKQDIDILSYLYVLAPIDLTKCDKIHLEEKTLQ